MAKKRGVRGIQAKVDEACKLNEEIKAKSQKLLTLKEEIKRHAMLTGNRGIKGDYGFAVVTAFTKGEIDATKAFNALGKDVKQFIEVVKVLKGEIVKVLDKDSLKKITNSETIEYGRVHLRKGNNGDCMNRLLRKLDV